jgi:predicted component of type VI protein secretion system
VQGWMNIKKEKNRNNIGVVTKYQETQHAKWNWYSDIHTKTIGKLAKQGLWFNTALIIYLITGSSVVVTL